MADTRKNLWGAAGQKHPTEGEWDFKPWLAQSVGIPLPPQAIAIYTESTGTFVCIAPEAELALIESLFGGFHRGAGVSQLQIDATLVSLECPSSGDVRNLSYEELRKAAGKSWREVEHFRVMTNGGYQCLSRRSFGQSPPEAKSTPQGDSPSRELVKLGKGETGCLIGVEPVIGPDGKTIELNYGFHRRSGAGAKTSELEVAGKATIKEGAPSILNLWPQNIEENPSSPNAHPRLLALVLQVAMIDQQGEPLRQAFEKKMQESKAASNRRRNSRAKSR